MTAFLTIFRRFPKIFQNCSEGQTNVLEQTPGISEDSQRCPKISEDSQRLSRKTRRCFDDRPTNLSTIKDTNLISVKASISSHVKTSFISYLLRFSDRTDRMNNSNGNFFIQSQSRIDFLTREKSRFIQSEISCQN